MKQSDLDVEGNAENGMKSLNAINENSREMKILDRQSREKIKNFVSEIAIYFVYRASSNHDILLVHYFFTLSVFYMLQEPMKRKTN